jgi:hypothetical protein
LPSFRGVVSPNRDRVLLLERMKATKEGETRFSPERYTCRNSPGRLKRADLGKAASRDRGSVVLNGEPLPSLRTPPLEDQSPGRGLHAMSKPVFLRTPPVVRLKCSLWHFVFGCSVENLKSTTQMDFWSTYVSDT